MKAIQQQTVNMVQFVITLVLSIIGLKKGKSAQHLKQASRVRRAWNKLSRPLVNQSGLQIIEVVGLALIGVLAIVIVWGLVQGWLPTFINNIFSKLDTL